VACKNVEAYLASQSKISSTYTGKMWQSGVDGPWRLTSFDNLGNATFQPNNKYSGPQKAQVQQVKLVAYTTAQAEENDLQAGKLTLGYVDTSILTSPAPKPGSAGPNWGQLSTRYNLVSGVPWSFNYAPINFAPTSSKAAVVSQLYFRQALQMGVDQAGIIKNVFKNYAYPQYSPLPPNTAAAISGPVPEQYGFDLNKAKGLLTSHGWTMQNGVMTCTSPGTGASQCGAGITQGYTLNFKLVYASGSPSLDQEWAAIIADWSTIGIVFTHTTETFNQVIGDCNSGSDFQLCMWGGGWIYAPDYYPSGETFFIPQGGFNIGAYSDSQMTSLVTATDFGTAKLTAYELYAAQQLPVLYLPNPAATTEVLKTLHSSVGWQSPLQNLMPEYMHY
jgi:peptide/nickel transport system substrate-binding protein